MTLPVLIRGVLGQYWFYRDICLVLVTQAGAPCTGVLVQIFLLYFKLRAWDSNCRIAGSRRTGSTGD